MCQASKWSTYTSKDGKNSKETIPYDQASKL